MAPCGHAADRGELVQAMAAFRLVFLNHDVAEVYAKRSRSSRSGTDANLRDQWRANRSEALRFLETAFAGEQDAEGRALAERARRELGL